MDEREYSKEVKFRPVKQEIINELLDQASAPDSPNPMTHPTITFSALAQEFMKNLPESTLDVHRVKEYDNKPPRAAVMKQGSDGLPCMYTKEKFFKKTIIMELQGDAKLSEEEKSEEHDCHVFKYPPKCLHYFPQKEVIAIDTKLNSRFLRRSCNPNSYLEHYKDSQGGVRIFVRALEDIPMDEEITVEFDHDFRYSKIPLECAFHRLDVKKCKLEKHRKVVLREIVMPDSKATTEEEVKDLDHQEGMADVTPVANESDSDDESLDEGYSVVDHSTTAKPPLIPIEPEMALMLLQNQTMPFPEVTELADAPTDGPLLSDDNTASFTGEPPNQIAVKGDLVFTETPRRAPTKVKNAPGTTVASLSTKNALDQEPSNNSQISSVVMNANEKPTLEDNSVSSTYVPPVVNLSTNQKPTSSPIQPHLAPILPQNMMMPSKVVESVDAREDIPQLMPTQLSVNSPNPILLANYLMWKQAPGTLKRGLGNDTNQLVTAIASSSSNQSNVPDDTFQTINKTQATLDVIVGNKKPKLDISVIPASSYTRKTLPPTPPNPTKHLKLKFSRLAQKFMENMPESPLDVHRVNEYDNKPPRAAVMKQGSDGLACIYTKTKFIKKDVIMELHGDAKLSEEGGPEEHNCHVFKYPPKCLYYYPQKEVIAIDTKLESLFLRRSCDPNSYLEHYKDQQGGVRILVRALEDIPMENEVTVAFDHDFRFSKVPLECALHRKNMKECKLEQHRKVVLREIVMKKK